MAEEGLEGMDIAASINRDGGSGVHQRAEATESTSSWGGGDASTLPERSGLGRL
jgi:hypothetical protein